MAVRPDTSKVTTATDTATGVERLEASVPLGVLGPGAAARVTVVVATDLLRGLSELD